MKIIKDVEKLIGIINSQLDLINIYRTFHQTAAEYIYFSKAHATFMKMCRMLGYKICPNIYKIIRKYIKGMKSCRVCSLITTTKLKQIAKRYLKYLQIFGN